MAAEEAIDALKNEINYGQKIEEHFFKIGFRGYKNAFDCGEYFGKIINVFVNKLCFTSLDSTERKHPPYQLVLDIFLDF